jgi:diguanylate cyclase (GGDEF)-like protein
MVQAPPAELVEKSLQLEAAYKLRPGAFGAVLMALVDQLNACFAVKDVLSGQYVDINDAMAVLCGRPVDQVIGQTDALLFGSELATAWRAADLSAAGQDTPHLSTHRIEQDRQRREFDVVRVALEPAEDGPVLYLCCIWIETTRARQREAQLAAALEQLEQQQIAAEALRRETQDSTLREGPAGLYQRSHFEDQLRREADLSSREHREFALVSIAIDPLSETARALGSGAHVRVLESLGRLLRSNTRAMDASCRVNSDHFAVLLSGVGLATAHSRMEGLRRQCATQIVMLDGREFGFTVSMGVASFPHTAHTQEELVRAADLALLEATRRGGNHVALASIRFESNA